jgi:hypothetical protein
VLRRLVELKEEVKLFWTEVNPTLADLFYSQNWLCKLSYLTDILEKLNKLNISLQGDNANILFLNDKITASVMKI